MAFLTYQELTSETGQARHVIHDMAADLTTDSIYNLLLPISRIGTFSGKADLGLWYCNKVLLIETLCQCLKLLLILTILFHSELGMKISVLKLML